MRLKMINPVTLFFTMMSKLIIGCLHIMAKMLYEMFKFIVLMWKILLIGMFNVVRKMLAGSTLRIHKIRLTRKSEV